MRRPLPLLLLLASCAKGGAAPDAGKAAEAAMPPEIRVTADRKDLIFTYPSEDGKTFATATEIGAVPEAARKQVVVTDLSLTPAQRMADRYVYLSDLTAPREDGTYPVAVASRYGFEAKLAGTSTGAIARAGGVVVYSTSWCGVCKKTKRLLEQLEVPFVEKDIEASRSAAEELAAKSQSAGIRPGGVPVIDVGGTLLQGLDEATLRSTLHAKGFL